MAEAIRVSGPVSGTDKNLSFETGKFAQQSQGAVMASLGRTTVLATANAAKDVRPGTDFFPLTIDVEERSYAAGKIPGSFFRREGRPTEDAILTCRLTDRPLRPAFPEGFRNETQVVLTVMGADMANPHDVLSINAASASLMISGIPFDGPIGAVRIAHSQTGEWIPHPTYEEGEASTFELVVAGRQLDSGDVAIMMVEAGGTAKSMEYYAAGAPKVDEKVLAGGLEASQDVHQGVDRAAASARRFGDRHAWPHRPDDVHPAARLRPGRVRRRCRHRRRRCGQGHHHQRQGRPQRGDRRRCCRSHREAVRRRCRVRRPRA